MVPAATAIALKVLVTNLGRMRMSIWQDVRCKVTCNLCKGEEASHCKRCEQSKLRILFSDTHGDELDEKNFKIWLQQSVWFNLTEAYSQLASYKANFFLCFLICILYFPHWIRMTTFVFWIALLNKVVWKRRKRQFLAYSSQKPNDRSNIVLCYCLLDARLLSAFILFTRLINWTSINKIK